MKYCDNKLVNYQLSYEQIYCANLFPFEASNFLAFEAHFNCFSLHCFSKKKRKVVNSRLLDRFIYLHCL